MVAEPGQPGNDASSSSGGGGRGGFPTGGGIQGAIDTPVPRGGSLPPQTEPVTRGPAGSEGDERGRGAKKRSVGDDGQALEVSEAQSSQGGGISDRKNHRPIHQHSRSPPVAGGNAGGKGSGT